jgi:hypothetical protein
MGDGIILQQVYVSALVSNHQRLGRSINAR